MNAGTRAGDLRPQAVALRRAGKSRQEIKQLLGITNNECLTKALAGEPPPAWTRRPRAKDGLRAMARELREQGLDYADISAELGVSKSSVSLWVRDMPRPARLGPEQRRQRSAEGAARYWAAERPAREAAREAGKQAAAAEVGSLSERELLIAGAVAYWCEGSKSKAYRRQDRVDFINSDPLLICLFLRFLDAMGVDGDQVCYRVCIHETANVAAAERYWARVTGADISQFQPPTLKRHNPKTVRKNVGEDYHGCLRIVVRSSASLYQRIEGWMRGITAASSPEADGEGWGCQHASDAFADPA